MVPLSGLPYDLRFDLKKWLRAPVNWPNGKSTIFDTRYIFIHFLFFHRHSFVLGDVFPAAIFWMTSWRHCCFSRLQRVTREDVCLKQWLYCPQNYWYVDIHERHQNSCIKSIEIYFRMSRKKPNLNQFVWWFPFYFKIFTPNLG